MAKKIVLLLVVMSMYVAVSLAQNRKITGTVIDSDTKEPLIGVSVSADKQSTQTDLDGHYSLNVPNGTVISFKYIGFKTQQFTVLADKTLNVTLESDAKALNEVVVVGYGTVKKSDLTGSVGVVKGEELAKTPVVNVAEALTGKVAGLQITTTEGSPDAEVKVRLRGGGSISQDNSPLYIVDGFPVSTISNIASSDIESITFLKDAASTAIYGSRAANGVLVITTKEGKEGKITVSANVYAGFRNITKEQEVLSPYEYVLYQYEIDQSSTFQNYYGVYGDLGIYKSMKGRDFQDEIFGGSAPQQYYNIGINGGSKETRFNLGLTRNKEESILLGSGYERNNLTFKLNTTISPKLSFDLNTRLSYMIIDGAGVSSGSGSTTRLRNAVKYAPTRGLRAFDQSAVEDQDDTNDPESQSLLYDPVQSILDEYKKQARFSNNLNAGVKWKITKQLAFRSEGGYEFKRNLTESVWGPATSNARNYAGQPIANVSTLNGSDYRFSNYFTYDNSKFINKDHSLNVVLGQELLSDSYKTVTNESRFFPTNLAASDVLANLNLGTPIPTVSYISADDNLSSFFGRVNYTFKNRYLATVTARADGSSKFAKGNRWGYFPSVALGWKINEEEFLQSQSNWIEQLKLRVSYGSTGNNRIPNGAWKTSYNTNSENKPYFTDETEDTNLIPGIVDDNGKVRPFLSNPNLKWETTINRNIGLDFSLFKGRLNGAVDYYYNTTKDLLVQAPLASSSGYIAQLQNFGSTLNKGIELSLDGYIIDKKDLRISAGFNIGFNTNEVTKFQNGDVNFKTYSSGWNGLSAAPLDDYIIQQGSPVGQMYGYVTDGMYTFNDFTWDAAAKAWSLNAGVASNQATTSATYFGPGALKFKDISGPAGIPDGKIDEYDKTIIGNANPKYTGGFNFNISYKSFDLAAVINFTVGNDIYNANKLDYSAQLLSRKYQNLQAGMDLAHRFSIIDPLTGLNIATGSNANPTRLAEINQNATIWSPLMTQTPLHSWAVEDGSFLRLNTLTLGYTVPLKVSKQLGMSNLRIYTSAYNLLVLTNYSGFDPEVDTRRNPPVTPGVDYSAYPKSRSFIAGLNVTF